MTDSISEDDIRKALREQLQDIGKDTTSPKKKKRSAKSRVEEPQQKKKKVLKEEKVSSSKNPTDTQRTPRPPPRIIVFEEPGKKVKDKKTSHTSSKLKDKKAEDSEGIDFLEIARDVKEFGMTGFSKKERRKYEQQKAQALGAKAPKGVKTPYNLLIARRKRQKQEEMERLELERAMGMATKKSKDKNKKKESLPSSIGWWTDKSSKGFDASIGKYKKGVQVISQSDIKKSKQRRK